MSAGIEEPLKEVTCLHCRWPMNRGQFLYRPQHISLISKPPFRPARWDHDGHPVDGEGTVCREKVCPSCRQPLPELFGAPDCDYRFISLVGRSLSGKSYFLATMMRSIGAVLGKSGLNLNDEDHHLNSVLWEQSRVPFRTDGPQSRYIDKTMETSESTYEKVPIPYMLEDHEFHVPKPFSFRLSKKESLETVLRFVLYDNEGEAFTATGRGFMAEEKRIATGHLAHSDLIMILYDPLQNDAICEAINAELKPDPKVKPKEGVDEQLTMIDEIAKRLDRSSSPPVAVMVGKSDAWKGLEAVKGLSASCLSEDGTLDEEKVDRNSEIIFSFLTKMETTIPQKISGVFREKNIRYFVVSSLGHPTVEVQNEGSLVNAPSRPAEPEGVVDPFLWGLNQMMEKSGKGKLITTVD